MSIEGVVKVNDVMEVYNVMEAITQLCVGRAVEADDVMMSMTQWEGYPM